MSPPCIRRETALSLVGALIAVSLLLLVGLGLASLWLGGHSSRAANADDPDGDDDR